MGSVRSKHKAKGKWSFVAGKHKDNNNNRLLQITSLGNTLKRRSTCTYSWCEETCRLPDPLLLKVLTYLSLQDRLRASTVCRKWRQISMDSSLWRKVDLSSKNSAGDISIRDRTIIYLTTQVSTSAIREISLSGRACRRITDVSLFYIARHCHKLHKLSVSSRKITDAGLKVIAEIGNCPNLQILELERCERVTSAGFTQVLRKLKELKKVNIAGNSWVTRCILDYIGQHCPDLESLSIEGCRKVTDTGLDTFASKCTSLKHINLRNTRSVTNAGVERFLKKLADLESLEIGIVRRSRTNAEVLITVAENCQNLVKLDYQDCNAPQVDNAICYVARNCHKLRELGVRQCLVMSNDTVNILKSVCPQLKSIDQSMRFYEN